MSIEIKVPVLPESVTDATVAKWYKSVGDMVSRDENLVDLETDKVMLEVPAPQGGVLQKIAFEQGSTVTAGQVLAIIDETAQAEPKEDSAPVQTAASEPSSNVPASDTPAKSDAQMGPAARRAVAESGVDRSEAAQIEYA